MLTLTQYAMIYITVSNYRHSFISYMVTLVAILRNALTHFRGDHTLPEIIEYFPLIIQ